MSPATVRFVLNEIARQRQAEQRAKRLLLRHLSPRQRYDYKRCHGSFTVVGKSGAKYRLNNGRLWLLKGKKRIQYWCVFPLGDPSNPTTPLPLGDRVLAQVLHLRADDAALGRKAGRTRYFS